MPKAAHEMWLNLALPGSGLVVRGQLAFGLILLLPALVCIALAALAPLVAERGFAFALSGIALAAYLVLGVVAVSLYAAYFRQRSWDANRVRALHLEAAEAFLKNQPQVALSAARRLVEIAATEIGAWRMLEMIAKEAKDAKAVKQAERAIKRLRAAEVE